MMRKIFLLCALIFACAITVNGYAQDNYADTQDSGYSSLDADKIPYENSPINKLGRGIINTATCWTEVPADALDVSRKQDPAVGCTLGVVEGVFTSFVRGLTGIFDVVTFVIPPYDKPIMKPEYAFTRADEKFKEYLW